MKMSKMSTDLHQDFCTVLFLAFIQCQQKSYFINYIKYFKQLFLNYDYDLEEIYYRQYIVTSIKNI